MIDDAGTFSGSNDRERREDSGALELYYLNLVKLAQGTVINDRYRLEKLIGQGGFGIVFEALDVTLNARVAVKFLNPRLVKNEQKFLRVKREINLSRKISDARIIKVFSLESWQRIHFLVMELAGGRSLKALLQEKGSVTWSEFKEIFLEILEAVEVLHASGIVHRDLKPANILVDDRLRVKILDFGLAKEVDDIEKTSTAGEVVGSPYFMSPEQIRGGAVDFQSDVYQLGLILYRTLSGRHPFEHTSTMEVIFKQLNQRPERLVPVQGGLPRFLRIGLEKALEKSPAKRFRDAGAMARFFKKDRLSWPQQVFFNVRRGPFKWLLAAALLAITVWLGFRATLGSQAIHDLRPQGGILEARNRLGVRLWRRDFSPFTVFHAHLTGSTSPVPLGTGIPEEYQGMWLNGAKVVFVLLAPSLAPVFPPEGSIASAGLMCQQAILDQRGGILRREPFLRDSEFDAYDYIRVIKPNRVRLLTPGAGVETDALVQVQQYQSMYPFAMVFMRGIKKYIYTNPGTFETFPQGERDGLTRFMFFGVNNLLSHMSFVAENGFTPATTAGVVIKGIPNLLTDGRTNIPFVGTLFILPSESRLIENRWQEEGWVSVEDGFMGDIVSVDRAGRLTVRGRGGISSYRDSPDMLRRVYTLVNDGYQERIRKCNLKNARELIGRAVAFPLQNPYLHSALLCMLGDLEIGLGLYADGEKSLARALEIYPGNNDAHERLCEMDVLKGEPEAALLRLGETFADGSKFWGFQTFGVSLFKGYVLLQQGMFSKANDEFAKIKLDQPGVVSLCRAAADVFGGNYAAAAAGLRPLERRPLETVDLRELRLLLGRALLLDFTDERRAKFLFEDIFRNSLEYGHLAEISTCYFLARSGRTVEAAKAAREAFTRLQARARGDFMARLWLFYDAYVYGRTMEMAGDRDEAARGYRVCIEANPYTELAGRSRQRLALLTRQR